MAVTINGTTNVITPTSAVQPTGAILQVLQTVKTDTQTGTTSGTDWIEVSGLTQAITPIATSSKVLVNISLGCDIETNHNGLVAQLFRDSTEIMQADALNSNIRCSFALAHSNFAKKVPQYTTSFLDSPSTTSAITYKIKLKDGNGDGGKIFVNRSRDTSTSNDTMVTCSSITLMEVAG